MAKKNLYFKFSDGADVENVVMDLKTAINMIESEDFHLKSKKELDEIEFTLKPVLMTERQFMNLHEANM